MTRTDLGLLLADALIKSASATEALANFTELAAAQGLFGDTRRDVAEVRVPTDDEQRLMAQRDHADEN